ncbi:MAG: hypothetical protein ABIG55_00980 [Candidatus Omnitrophota bacterium]|nr:hypothetical protein [Candidatus Omnitrophota bacterium]
MKRWGRILIIPLFFLGTASFSQEEPEDIQKAEFSVRKEGEIIVIEQNEQRYEYPSSKREYAGIKKVEKADVNGDGVEEYIIAAQLQETEIIYPSGRKKELPMSTYGTTLICEYRPVWGETLIVMGQMSPGKIWPSFKILDVDGDGIKDVMAIGYTYGNWQQLQIASWQNGGYAHIWNKGGGRYTTEHAYSVDEKGRPTIKVGYPTSSEGVKKQQYIIDEWETWVWDGSKFIPEGELEEEGKK